MLMCGFIVVKAVFFVLFLKLGSVDVRNRIKWIQAM